jgi:PAS domain-containing protein
MRTLCAWCGKSIDGEGGPAPQDAPITHGICVACSEAVLADAASLASFLDGMKLPVLLMDANAAVLTANAAARATLGLDLPKLQGELAGDVIQCEHAALPGGCGKQLHCVACQIRASVTSTYRTGAALEGIQAYQDVRGPQGRQRLYVRISTEKVGDAVLLRVDAMERTPGS